MKTLAANDSTPKVRFSSVTLRGRKGLTLVELMVAVVITLIIVAAMIRAFKLSSDEISAGRAAMDMHNQLRTVTETLRRDLENATCVPRPRGTNDERSGYFEVVEGGEHDHDFVSAIDSYLGDHDDILALTVRSTDRPFRGRVHTSIDASGFVESYLAEVIWWVTHADTDGDGFENITIHRRTLLIRPDLGPFSLASSSIAGFFEANDLSARPDGFGRMIGNSLEDLALRENRYAHLKGAGNFPHEIQNGIGSQQNWLFERVLGVDGGDGVFIQDRLGEDVMLPNATAFNIQIYSPNAPVKFADNEAVDISDPGFSAVSTTAEAVGGYVDLGHFSGKGLFQHEPYPNYLPPANQPYAPWDAATFCTWTAHYESDGIDQDGVFGIDQGTNGIDDDGINGVDDNGERETQPPYPYPIRSIQISVRMIDNNTKQVLQKTVKHSFVPN